MSSTPTRHRARRPHTGPRLHAGLRGILPRLERWKPALLVVPAITLLVVIRLVPLLESAYLSLTDWDGFSQPNFIGLDNYHRLAQDPRLAIALKNTTLALLTIPIWVALPLLFAVLIHQRVPGWRLWRISIFLPAVLSAAAIGTYWVLLLRRHGPVNSALEMIGLEAITRPWLQDPSLAFGFVVAIVIWSSIGIGVVLYLGALGGIDPALYDLAKLDGSSWFTTLRTVIIPSLYPVIGFWSVIVVVNLFTSMAGIVLTTTDGGPGHLSGTVDFRMYLEAFRLSNAGYATAIGIVLLGIVSTFLALQLWIMIKRDPSR